MAPRIGRVLQTLPEWVTRLEVDAEVRERLATRQGLEAVGTRRRRHGPIHSVACSRGGDQSHCQSRMTTMRRSPFTHHNQQTQPQGRSESMFRATRLAVVSSARTTRCSWYEADRSTGAKICDWSVASAAARPSTVRLRCTSKPGRTTSSDSSACGLYLH